MSSVLFGIFKHKLGERIDNWCNTVLSRMNLASSILFENCIVLLILCHRNQQKSTTAFVTPGKLPWQSTVQHIAKIQFSPSWNHNYITQKGQTTTPTSESCKWVQNIWQNYSMNLWKKSVQNCPGQTSYNSTEPCWPKRPCCQSYLALGN